MISKLRVTEPSIGSVLVPHAAPRPEHFEHLTGLGVAVKVADGNKRGLFPAVVAVLDQLGLLDAERRSSLAPMREPVVFNYRGIATGRVRPVVVLDRGSAGR